MALDTITVFTADGCPHCRNLCADFRRRGVEFREVNISENPEAIAEIRALSWEDRLPVTVDHERVSIGFCGRSSSFISLGLA